jgi:two-component system, response regulator PdtaR
MMAQSAAVAVAEDAHRLLGGRWMNEWLRHTLMQAATAGDPAEYGCESGPVVVVAEDEQLVRMRIAEALADAGCHVIESSDARDAMALLRAREDVRVLVTDIRMSSTDGLALAHRVAERWPHIGIVLISGVFEPNAAARPSGSRFLLKPCRSAKIVDTVRDLIGPSFVPAPSGA